MSIETSISKTKIQCLALNPDCYCRCTLNKIYIVSEKNSFVEMYYSILCNYEKTLLSKIFTEKESRALWIICNFILNGASDK